MPDNHNVVDSLYRISSLAGNTENPQEALDIILREVVDVLNANSASVALINPDTNRLEIEVFHGLPDYSKEVQLQLGQGVTGWVALHGKPLLLPNVHADPRYFPVKDSIRSEMAVPMEEGGTVIGVINVDSEQEGCWDAEDLKVLTLLTNEAAKVVSRLWLIQQLKEKSTQLESLVSAGGSLVAKLEIDELLELITRQALSIMRVRLSALFLVQPGGERIALHSVASKEGCIDYEETLHVYQSALGTVVMRKRPIEVIDLAKTEEHHFVGLTQTHGLKSMLAVPVVFEGTAIGVITVYTDRPHRFSNEEKNVLGALSNHAAVAIQNARLYERVFSTEEILRQNERLTTLGLLSSEIAHEIRNPLMVIKLLFDSLGLEFPAEDMRAKDVSIIREKLKQLESTVNRVLHFGKAHESLHARCVVSELIEDTLLLMRLKLKQQKITLDYSTEDKPLVIDVHKGQIQQVLLNLIINATQAMPGGGTIRVHSHAEAGDSGRIAVIEISDTGSGISSDIRDRIFDSFLTDKPGGTGLGLSIAKSIIESHRGSIDVKDTSETGTTIRLWLPLA